MRTHREGYKIILITTIACIVAWLLIKTYVPIPLVRYILLVGLVVLLLWVVRFFRYPKRKINFGDHILSTADGKIEAIDSPGRLKSTYNAKNMDEVFLSIAR